MAFFGYQFEQKCAVHSARNGGDRAKERHGTPPCVMRAAAVASAMVCTGRRRRLQSPVPLPVSVPVPVPVPLPVPLRQRPPSISPLLQAPLPSLPLPSLPLQLPLPPSTWASACDSEIQYTSRFSERLQLYGDIAIWLYSYMAIELLL